MRRVWFGVVLFVVAAVLAGCGTSLPPGYRPPVIESVQVSPQPVSAGGTVTMVVEASDDEQVAYGAVWSVITPDGIELEAVCTSETAPREDVKHARITIACPVPAYATNGTWQLKAYVSDGIFRCDSCGVWRLVPFEVVDGTEDHSPPQLVHYGTEPATVTQATTFTLTMRVRDEAFPVDFDFGPTFVKQFNNYSQFVCHDRSDTPVSSTEVDMVWTCSPQYYGQSGPTEVGIHQTGVRLRDALGHEWGVQMFVDARPA